MKLWIMIALAFVFESTPLVSSEFWTSKKASDWSETEARKILSQSPWAKRAKLRSTISAPAGIPVQPRIGAASPSMRDPGPGGPGSGVPVPLTNNGMADMQPIPCLGWGAGIGSDLFDSPANLPSPTSDECKAAWKSVSATSAALSAGSVIVLWESAAPVREAKTRLAIDDPVNNQAERSFVISVIGYPLLINVDQGSMRRLMSDSAVLLRKGRQAIQASNVAVIETQGTIIRFFFSRQESIQPGDRAVVFRFLMGSTLVEATFDLKEMACRGVPAL